MSRSRRLRNRSGQALVEFALTVPILLFLVVGIIEFGRLMSAQQTITDTAREAARRAVVADAPSCQSKTENIESMIHRRLDDNGLNSNAATIAIDCGASGNETTVTLRYAYYMGWLGPLMGWTTGRRTVSLNTAARMRQE